MTDKFLNFSNYLETKETAWKGGDGIFLEQKMIWSSLGPFWNVLIKIKQLKSLMVLSLAPKILRAVDFLSYFK